MTKTIVAAAIAKGAMAGGSTFILIEGALKLMAGTKAKMAVAGGVALLLATTGTMTVRHYLNPPPPPPTDPFHLPTGNGKPMIGTGNGFRVILATDGSLWSCGEEPQGFPSLGLSDIGIHNTVALRRIGNETNWARTRIGERAPPMGGSIHCSGNGMVRFG